MTRSFLTLLASIILFGATAASAEDAKPMAGKPAGKYFAHPAVEDRHGVIAPWYTGLNGQCDFRVRVAAETLKRYPWADKPQAVMAAPHFVFNGHWQIHPDGTVFVDPELHDWQNGQWDNGDLGQRSLSLLSGMSKYYRYSGDPAAIGIVTLTADYLLDYCQTPAEHSWPRFLISCPNQGKAYGRANPHGSMQLDYAAWAGSGLVEAYRMTGTPRYREAAEHWADLLAEHCDFTPGVQPWNRYANFNDAETLTKWKWTSNTMTGGVCLIVQFLDDVIGLGHRGKDDRLLRARHAGDYYLREVLLPQWTRDPTWGHHFWDGIASFDSCTIPCLTAEYFMNRPQAFPNWRTDTRNILSLLFCRAGVDPDSASGIYAGAWTIPESGSCCGKSLQYPTMFIASTLARFAAMTGDAWAKEVSRRQSILTTYDAHETGVVEDLIDGGAYIATTWFNLAHPWPLWTMLECLAWQPEIMGANRENHIMRTSSVVRQVTYGRGYIAYTTYDATVPSEDVLRLAFVPTKVTADGKPLAKHKNLSSNGYSVKLLANGDCILTVRHDGCRQLTVEGEDPQQEVNADRLQYVGQWSTRKTADTTCHVASAAGATASFGFEGNQVRLIGAAGPDGGQADVYLDGVKQLCGIDCWCPEVRRQQVLCYKNGLTQGKHTLKIAVRGTKNPYATATDVAIAGVQWSDATGSTGYGEGEGPAEAQRFVFGYTSRKDYVDSEGHAWRPATEFILRLNRGADLVPLALWTSPRTNAIGNTKDPELYRYGVFGQDFTAYFTVKPTASYHVRIKLCQTAAPKKLGGYATSIDVAGKTVVTDLDIAATAGGLGKAVDLVFNDVGPKNGVIAVRFWHRLSGQAMCQAVEIGPGRAEPGAKPVSFQFSQGPTH